jgi:hypothetical protein
MMMENGGGVAHILLRTPIGVVVGKEVSVICNLGPLVRY